MLARQRCGDATKAQGRCPRVLMPDMIEMKMACGICALRAAAWKHMAGTDPDGSCAGTRSFGRSMSDGSSCVVRRGRRSRVDPPFEPRARITSRRGCLARRSPDIRHFRDHVRLHRIMTQFVQRTSPGTAAREHMPSRLRAAPHPSPQPAPILGVDY